MTETETKTNALLSRLPELQGGKMPPIDPALTNELVPTLLKGGKDAITGLIDTLREVDNGSDWKARFLVQALVSAVGTAAQAPQRQMLTEILLAEATGSRPAAVRTFLLTRLRLIADTNAVAKLIPLLAWTSHHSVMPPPRFWCPSARPPKRHSPPPSRPRRAGPNR